MTRRRIFAPDETNLTDELIRATANNDALIEITEGQIRALVEQEKTLDSPAWKNIIESYLPAEIRRIEHNRGDEEKINPFETSYERKQLIAHGQLKECQIMIGRLSDVRGNLARLRSYLLDLLRERRNIERKSLDHRKKVAKILKNT